MSKNPLRAHAERELDIIGMKADQESMNGAMREHLLRMVDLFSEEGHSGFSAAYAVSVLPKLLSFEPLSPLTGEDDEWNEVSDGLWQNKRCSHVFKDRDGGAYDSEGRIFREPDGMCFTNAESRVPITFPYTPQREYVERTHAN